MDSPMDKIYNSGPDLHGPVPRRQSFRGRPHRLRFDCRRIGSAEGEEYGRRRKHYSCRRAATASIWMRSSRVLGETAAARRRATHSVAHDITAARIMQASPRTIQLASHKFNVRLKR